MIASSVLVEYSLHVNMYERGIGTSCSGTFVDVQRSVVIERGVQSRLQPANFTV